MQLSCIMISSVPISIFLALCSIRRICDRRGYCKLGGDLLERCLRVWQSELMAEEGGFGGIAIGCRDVEGLSRVNE